MKRLSEYTDRELMEEIATNSKVTADSVWFIKNFIIVSTIVSIILALIAIF